MKTSCQDDLPILEETFVCHLKPKQGIPYIISFPFKCLGVCYTFVDSQLMSHLAFDFSCDQSSLVNIPERRK